MPWTYFLHLSLSSVILIDSSTESPIHALMLSIQAVRGLPRLRAPGIVVCIIAFSRQTSALVKYVVSRLPELHKLHLMPYSLSKISAKSYQICCRAVFKGGGGLRVHPPFPEMLTRKIFGNVKKHPKRKASADALYVCTIVMPGKAIWRL